MNLFDYRIIDFDNYDGDSFDLKLDLGFHLFVFRQCRLHGIDTPELRGGTALSKQAGYLARDWSRKWVEYAINDEGAVFRSLNYTGKYGRPLGDIVRVADEVSLVQTLIEQRLGVPYFGQSKSAIAGLHEQNFKYLVDEGVLIKDGA